MDLIAHLRTGKKVEVFDSVEELSKYTLKHERQFPPDRPQAGGVHHYLLRDINDPSMERDRDRVKASLKNMNRLKHKKLQKRKEAHT